LDLKQYYKAVKVYKKGNKIENLIKRILEDIQLLACKYSIKTVTKAQQEQIVQAIIELTAVVLSVPNVIAGVARGQQEGLQYSRDNNIIQNNSIVKKE
jgi:hypothetical protein